HPCNGAEPFKYRRQATSTGNNLLTSDKQRHNSTRRQCRQLSRLFAPSRPNQNPVREAQSQSREVVPFKKLRRYFLAFSSKRSSSMRAASAITLVLSSEAASPKWTLAVSGCPIATSRKPPKKAYRSSASFFG